ncbi:Response regulator receiver domain-containing protein [Hyphomicrobiales bacterium]|nr:Response regulator receiver domain-containing protein [Hyphomicrobiales bacterium]CAH1667541.1 Response regulator receiver domain-containing protein [Hyphomicrobiales bacterium]
MLQTGKDAPQHDAEALRILLVEDQPLVRLTTSDMLSDLGHIVEEAADAQSAIAYVETGAPIDVLITDIGLPDISGTTLAEECRRRLPGLRVIFVSGTDAGRMDAILEDRQHRFLEKPFLARDLERMLAEIASS